MDQQDWLIALLRSDNSFRDGIVRRGLFGGLTSLYASVHGDRAADGFVKIAHGELGSDPRLTNMAYRARFSTEPFPPRLFLAAEAERVRLMLKEPRSIAFRPFNTTGNVAGELAAFAMIENSARGGFDTLSQMASEALATKPPDWTLLAYMLTDVVRWGLLYPADALLWVEGFTDLGRGGFRVGVPGSGAASVVPLLPDGAEIGAVVGDYRALMEATEDPHWDPTSQPETHQALAAARLCRLLGCLRRVARRETDALFARTRCRPALIGLFEQLDDPVLVKRIREGRNLNGFAVYMQLKYPLFRQLEADVFERFAAAAEEAMASGKLMSRRRLARLMAEIVELALASLGPHLRG